MKYDKKYFTVTLTLILNLDQDMVKLYLYTKNEVTSYSSSKVVT